MMITEGINGFGDGELLRWLAAIYVSRLVKVGSAACSNMPLANTLTECTAVELSVML